MKYLVLMIVVVGVAWWMWGRRDRKSLRPSKDPAQTAGADTTRAAKRTDHGAPQAMLACAHCGVHLPASDTVPDAQGQRYCSEAHRLAGPAPR